MAEKDRTLTSDDGLEVHHSGDNCKPPQRATVPRLPLDERLALALHEDCFTQLDEADISNVVEAVLPVARRYASQEVERVQAEREDALGAISDAVFLVGRFDPTRGSARTRAFLADLERLLRGRKTPIEGDTNG